MTYFSTSGQIFQSRGDEREEAKVEKKAQENLTEVIVRGGLCSSSLKGSLLFFQSCVRTFHETPLQLLEKIKDVFNKTKNLLETDWNIFSKNCKESFDKCSSPGKHRRASYREGVYGVK